MQDIVGVALARYMQEPSPENFTQLRDAVEFARLYALHGP